MQYKIYQYNDNDFRIVCFNGSRNGRNISNITDDYISSDNSLQCAISRSKRMIREYALCNDFDYFVTLTINSANCDRFSLTDCEDNIRRRLKTYKQYNKNFIYLLIAEKHEKGGFHFHGLFGGCNSKDIVEFKKEDFDKLPVYILRQIEHGKHIYYSKVFDKKTGFCTLTKIEDKSKCSNYITKYILKNPLRNENNTLYICSRGLKTSYNYPIMPINYERFCDVLQPRRKNVFQNDYVKIIDYRISDLTQEQIMFLQDNIKEEPTIIDLLKNRLERKKVF